jgi:hypothetical protein
LVGGFIANIFLSLYIDLFHILLTLEKVGERAPAAYLVETASLIQNLPNQGKSDFHLDCSFQSHPHAMWHHPQFLLSDLPFTPEGLSSATWTVLFSWRFPSWVAGIKTINRRTYKNWQLFSGSNTAHETILGH